LNRGRLEFGKVDLIWTQAPVRPGCTRSCARTSLRIDTTSDFDFLANQRLQTLIRRTFDLVHVPTGRRFGTGTGGARRGPGFGRLARYRGTGEDVVFENTSFFSDVRLSAWDLILSIEASDELRRWLLRCCGWWRWRRTRWVLRLTCPRRRLRDGERSGSNQRNHCSRDGFIDHLVLLTIARCRSVTTSGSCNEQAKTHQWKHARGGITTARAVQWPRLTAPQRFTPTFLMSRFDRGAEFQRNHHCACRWDLESVPDLTEGRETWDSRSRVPHLPRE